MTIRVPRTLGTIVLLAQFMDFSGCSSSGSKAATGGATGTGTGGASNGAGGATGSTGGASNGTGGSMAGQTGGSNGAGGSPIGQTGGSNGTGGMNAGGGGNAGSSNGGGGGAGPGMGGGLGGQSGGGGATTGGGMNGQDAGTDSSSSDAATACAGAGKSLHFADDVGGVKTTSMQVLADLGADLPIGNAARTIEMWLYMEGNESWKSGHSIVEYGGVGRCNAFGIDGGDNQTANPAQFDPFTFSAGGPCTGDNNVAITPAPARTGWLHLALSYDPAGIGGQAGVNFLFTVNGVAQPIPAKMQTGALLTMKTVVVIGSGQDASSDTGNGFTGKIDEVRIWNVGRTNAEIMDNYQLILHGDEAGLVAYYQFDDGTGTAPKDSSSKHHDAMFATNGGRPVPTWVDSTGLTLTCKP